MYKYVCVTENAPNQYEVFNIIRSSDGSEPFVARLESAFENGYEVVGMDASEHGENASNGSIWDGTSFSGDKKITISDDFIWDGMGVFVYMANNKIIYVTLVKPGDYNLEMYKAAFSQNVKLIKAPLDQVVTIGYIWDGTQFNPPA